MKTELTELEHCKFNVHCEANFIEISDKRAEVEQAFKKAPVKGFPPKRLPSKPLECTMANKSTKV